MARVVEICGAPGVGKSTIFAEIMRRRKKKYNWTTVSISNPYGEEDTVDFVKRVLRAPQGGSLEHSEIGSDLLFRIKKIVREIRKGKNYVNQAKLKEAGERFVAKYPEYVEACWNNIYYRQKRSTNGMDLRFEKTEFIYRIIKKVQVINENEIDKTVITDEGLVNLIDRALYKNTEALGETKEIERLLGIMPLPQGIIYLEADLEENARRLLTRNDLRDMHKGLELEELKNFTNACRNRIKTTINLLRDRGKPVLYLDSSDSIEENASKIIEFAYNMGLREPALASREAIIQ